MNKLIIIAAIGKNNELGKDNDLIWHLKKDMIFFKEHTINHHVLMGKNTFLSLPKMLKDRTHIVLTTKKDYVAPDGVIVLNSIEEFNEYSKSIDDDIYVIGGASIYKEFIDKADLLYLTLINDECKDADVFFPEINYEDYDQELLKSDVENDISFEHILYKRKKS